MPSVKHKTEGADMFRTKTVPQIRWLIRRDMVEVLHQQATGFGKLGFSEDELIGMLRERNCIGMVAEFNGCVVGHMVYKLHPDRIVLVTLAVDPKWRLRGIGKAMLAKLEGKLSQTRRELVEVTVSERNLDAHRWLKKCGWPGTMVDFGGGPSGEDAYVFQVTRSNCSESK